jgi:hypothetical protein
LKLATNPAYAFESDVQSVEDQPVSVAWNGQTSSYNLAHLLSFKTNLEDAIANHASTQAYWEQLAIEFQSQAQRFETEGYARWWAHSRRYSRLVMRALQVSETLESLKDWVITVYSKDTTGLELDGYVESGYRGWLLEKHHTLAKVEAFLKKQEGTEDPLPGFADFRGMMLSYVSGGWHYEDVVATLRTLKDQAAKVSVVAKNLNNAAFDMKAYKDLMVAKFGNVDPKLNPKTPPEPLLLSSNNNDKPAFKTSRKTIGAQNGT